MPHSNQKEREIEVVENEGKASLSGNDAALATYSYDSGPLTFKILPVVSGSGTDWRLVAYSDGIQGPVFKTTDSLSSEAAAELGVSEQTRKRLNDALSYADRHLSLAPELGDRERDSCRLQELEAAMEQNDRR
ncbi:hypothetical protein [Haloarcula sp. H-GB5]